MMRPSLAEEDDLTRLTRRVLADFRVETRVRGHAVGKVLYREGDADRTFPLDFDDFLQLGRDLLCAKGPQRTETMLSMGSTFALLSMSLAQDMIGQPERLASERKNWDETLCGILRARGPRTVVIARHIVLWPTAIAPFPIESPVIVAVGLHTTRIVAYASSHRAGEQRGMSFGKPVALSTRLAHVLGENQYLKIFGPGKN